MSKFTTQDKVNMLTLLLSGETKSAVCRRYGVEKKELTMWTMRYRRNGLRGLERLRHRRRTEDNKRSIVECYLTGTQTMRQTAVDNDISLATLKNWLRRYRDTETATAGGGI